MIEVEHTLEIARPIDEVFGYLTDVARIPEWQASAEEATLEGELGEGAEIREVRSMMGRRAVSTIGGRPSTTLRSASRSTSIEGPITYAVEHELESRRRRHARDAQPAAASATGPAR